MRSKVEHSFRIAGRPFGYSKVAYRGLRENPCRLHMLFALSDPGMCSEACRSPCAAWGRTPPRRAPAAPSGDL